MLKIQGVCMKPLCYRVLKYEDLEERTLELIKSLREEHGLFVVQQFREANLMGIQNVSAYLGSLVKNFKERLRQIGPQEATTRPLVTGPNLENMKKILEQSGYSLEVTIGQRKYGGPPPNWEGAAPGAGCEVYIGKIPKDVFEDELIPLFEQCGRIWDLRLMMDPVTGNNKGYAFVTYCERGHAAEAAKKFEGHEIKPGKRLRVNVSVANTRLFVGNIPKSKGKEEIMEELCKPAEGISDVIVYANPDDPAKKKNRGFCFLEFSDHKSASQAKRKLSNSRLRPWNAELVIEWAEPQEEPDEETMNKVKVLYVRPVKDSFTEEKIKEEFQKFGEVERVKKVKDYAFVHFTERENAMKAMTALKGNELDGVTVEVSLAKPQSEKKRKDQTRQRRGGGRSSSNKFYGSSAGRKGGAMGYGRDAPPLMSMPSRWASNSRRVGFTSGKRQLP
ncbi:unnamed protein product [Soboliphyme baturini]|uniref:Heterogeneous nuclear ribonucleoprotein R n=1 Tax=Soboliphyme baturini TaxID=241478 RepID=A0A183IVE9_9BILA|nr:unnamed protein product [Soboliphyme baturini]